MKVLEPGQPRPWSIRQTCTGKGNSGRGCGAVLLVEEGDLFLTYSTDREGTTASVTFECPQEGCRAKTDLPPATDLPVPKSTLSFYDSWLKKKRRQEAALTKAFYDK